MTRSASPVIFGFDFQSNSAIILMLENMAEMKTVRIEGAEDIEIGLKDGTYVLAQAKSEYCDRVDNLEIKIQR